MQEAINDYNKGIALSPNAVRAYCCRALAHQSKGDFTKAIEDFDRAASLDPEYPDVYLYKGNCLFSAKDYLASIEQYNKTLDILNKHDLST